MNELFLARYSKGKTYLMGKKIDLSDCSELIAYRRIREKYRLPFMLDSSPVHAGRSRFTVIGCKPDIIWRVSNGQAQISSFPDLERFIDESLSPIESLRALVERCRMQLPRGVPDIATGLFGYLGYDFVRYIEELPLNHVDAKFPTATMMRPTLTFTSDMAAQSCSVYRLITPQNHCTASDAWETAQSDLNQFARDLLTVRDDEADWNRRHKMAVSGEHPTIARNDNQVYETTKADSISAAQSDSTHNHTKPVSRKEENAYQVTSSVSSQRYIEMVERAKEYIRQGDAFQIVLSQRFEYEYKGDALPFFSVLREINPSPYLFFFEFDGFTIAGSSPEILVRYHDEVMTVRPLAGTRPRGEDEAQDRALEDELLSDPKELAEHMMLLDLGRNDVGKVSIPGGVQITQKFAVERYSAVMHIVSDVIGRVSKEHSAIDALIAGFPAGTLSGAPKIRAMEIIEELEPNRREIYGGAAGYFSASGNMDTCIAIRTAIFADDKISAQAGAGVVADSEPEKENQECWNKAMALLRAAVRSQKAWT